MKRSFNYTGRRNLPSGSLKIRLHRGSSSGELPRFTAELEGLKELGLPEGARVYVEPYVGATTMRFPFGNVTEIVPPTDTALTELDVGTSVLFRVKVVDESRDPCLIVASENQLRPLNDNDPQDERRAILPVRETTDLGEDLWVLDIKPEVGPELVINNGIPEFLERLKSDPLMQGLILPHALREVLTYIFRSDEIEDDAPWVEAWLEFASEISRSPPPDMDIEEDNEAADVYVDACVRAFCDRQKFKTMSLAMNKESTSA